MPKQQRKPKASGLDERHPDDPGRLFVEAMIADGFKPFGKADQEFAGLWGAAHVFARRKLQPRGEYLVRKFTAGTYVTKSGHAAGRLFFGLDIDAAIEEAKRDDEAAMELARQHYARTWNEAPRRVVATVYTRMTVYSTGQVDLQVADPERGEAYELDRQFSHYGRHHTTWFLPETEMTEDQARAMAKDLEGRLRSELKPIFRPVRPGKAVTRARRVQHGLSPEGLASFAAEADRRTEGAKNPAKVRDEVAAEFGIPSKYGGKARDEALRRLVREGRALAKPKAKAKATKRG